jgi:hypothetical protein
VQDPDRERLVKLERSVLAVSRFIPRSGPPFGPGLRACRQGHAGGRGKFRKAISWLRTVACGARILYDRDLSPLATGAPGRFAAAANRTLAASAAPRTTMLITAAAL